MSQSVPQDKLMDIFEPLAPVSAGWDMLQGVLLAWLILAVLFTAVWLFTRFSHTFGWWFWLSRQARQLKRLDKQDVPNFLWRTASEIYRWQDRLPSSLLTISEMKLTQWQQLAYEKEIELKNFDEIEALVLALIHTLQSDIAIYLRQQLSFKPRQERNL